MNREIFLSIRQGGWYPERKVDPKRMVQFLQSKGFLLNKAILKVLQEFGELEFETKNSYDQFGFNVHHTIPQKAIGSLDARDFQFFEDQFGEKLVPLGEIYNRYLFLFVSETGKFYSDFGFIGNDFPSAFEQIYEGAVKKFLSCTFKGNHPHHFLQNICLATDRTTPNIIQAKDERKEEGMMEDLKFAGTSGVFSHKPLFYPNKFFSKPLEYKNYYKFGITDAGIDRLLIENTDFKNKKNIPFIRSQMARFRQKMVQVKMDARKQKALAFDASPSFELWPIEYCAEVWAARSAILNGLKFEHIAFSLFRISDKSFLAPCNNCKRIFGDNYREVDDLSS